MNTPNDSLNRELIVPRTAAPGDTVPIVLRVTNVRNTPLDLALQGREIVFDIVVTDSTGQEIYRRLAGQKVQALLQLKTLRPGEAFELTDHWKVASELRGEVTVAGAINTDAQPILFRPARVRIR